MAYTRDNIKICIDGRTCGNAGTNYTSRKMRRPRRIFDPQEPTIEAVSLPGRRTMACKSYPKSQMSELDYCVEDFDYSTFHLLSEISVQYFILFYIPRWTRVP